MEEVNTLEEIEKGIVVVEEIYQETLAKLPIVFQADNAIKAFREETVQMGDATLPLDRIRYYLTLFPQISYDLGVAMATQKVRAEVMSQYHNQAKSKAFLDSDSEASLDALGKKKLIREEKDAVASLQSHDEELLKTVYKQVSEALYQRTWGINGCIDTLKTVANLTMQEMKQQKGSY